VTVNGTKEAFPIVVSGPSGVGKTTIVDRVLEADRTLRESISATTRRPRDGEIAGTHYFFVSADEFERMKEDELVEWAEVHGECYGTPRGFVEKELASGREVILNIDVQGAELVKKAFPDAVMVFILPPSFETLEERIRKRGVDANIDVSARLQTAREEINASKNYDYIIVNEKIATAVAQLAAIIMAERCRQGRRSIELD
jgi:guanylate kinase